MKELPAAFRLTQHSVSKRWRVERLGEDGAWYHVQDVLCEGGWGGRTFLFKWWAQWAMCNMIAAEIERTTYNNGKWEQP